MLKIHIRSCPSTYDSSSDLCCQSIPEALKSPARSILAVGWEFLISFMVFSSSSKILVEELGGQ